MIKTDTKSSSSPIQLRTKADKAAIAILAIYSAIDIQSAFTDLDQAIHPDLLHRIQTMVPEEQLALAAMMIGQLSVPAPTLITL